MKKLPLYLILGIALCLLGCSSLSPQEKLERRLNSGLGLAIVPLSASPWSTGWRSGANALSELGIDEYNIPRYAIMSGVPGAYGVASAFSRKSARGFKLPRGGDYTSTLGQIKVIKTPEREQVAEQRQVARKVKDASGLERVEYTYETEWVTRKIASYYEFTYLFDNAGAPAIGAAILPQGGLLVFPEVAVDVDFDPGSCKIVKMKENTGLAAALLGKDSFVAQVLEVLDDDRGDINGFATWEWNCPVRRLAVTVKEPKLYEVLSRVDPELLPFTFIQKIAAARFEPGWMLERADEARALEDGSVRYVFTDKTEESRKAAPKPAPRESPPVLRLKDDPLESAPR